MKKIIILFYLVIFFSSVFANCDDDQININYASKSELEEIVWIGEVTAEKIIDERPFDEIKDLDDIDGIGEKKLSDIIDEGLACVDEEDDEDEEVEEAKEELGVEVKGNKNETIILNEEPTEIILNTVENETKENFIYFSRDAKVVDNLVYAFCVFLIILIFLLIWKRF